LIAYHLIAHRLIAYHLIAHHLILICVLVTTMVVGMESFAGKAFHTSRWDYGFTKQDLSGLKGLRVGIIGTGATAVQAVPHLGEAASHLYVFQRTPSSVDVRNDFATDQEWAANLPEGWSMRRRQVRCV
jgi:cation diffusion facilitator CzcD-associated flavoprotein CzcO